MDYVNSRGRVMPQSAQEQGRISGTSAGNETISAPDGHSSLSGEGGGDLLIGNSYDNRHWITDRQDRVVEAADGGIDTQIGWTSIALADNVENLEVRGAFNHAVGNELDNLITVGDDSHWVYGGAGDDVLIGGDTGKVSYIVRAGEGSDVIYNWNGNSQLQLLNYSLSGPTDVRAAMTQDGADVVLALSATETLTFRETTMDAFADRQFLLPLDRSLLGAETFADEFDALQVYDPSLQTGIWNPNFGGNYKDPWAFTLPSNGERQVYVTADFSGQGEASLDINPFSINDGVLTITAEPIPETQRDAAWGREYSSGMLNTLGAFEQQYGYFEMRAELPTAAGSWPAFWMMPSPYVAQVEADIMEGLAVTPHVDYRRAWGGSENLYDNAYKIDPEGFHTYGMLWTPDTVTFYHDDVAVLQAPTPANWTHPMGMILNLAVGGWGGEPDSLQFPAEMKIDYVRAYALAEGDTVIQRTDPLPPGATLRAEGGPTSGEVNVAAAFQDNGEPVTTAEIAVFSAKPVAPTEETFVIWEDGGAVFGAVAEDGVYGQSTALMAGSSSTFTGDGTWLTDGRVVLGYMMPDGAGEAAWAMVFDPSKLTFARHELGAADGDLRFVAIADGGFVASWDTLEGTVMGRAFDAFIYDGGGWYGPTRQLAGDITGVTASGELITTDAEGVQQLYDVTNPPKPINAVVSIGPMAGVAHAEGDTGAQLFTFTLIRDWDQSEKSTVGWTVHGQGANPTNAEDFQGGVPPTGVATFEINQTTAFVEIWVQGDALAEQNEEFLVTLVNPVGAKLGQASATGFITNDDAGGAEPPPVQAQVALTSGTVTHAEVSSGFTAFAFSVERSGPATEASTVDWTVAGAGANPATGADFQGGTTPSGSLTFGVGETIKTITVNVVGDTVVEPDEAFTLTLSAARGAALGTATATGVILNDDAPQSPAGGQLLTSDAYGTTLVGGAGADTLVAGQGPDMLTGGGGGDSFVYQDLVWSAGEITDFLIGADRLDFSSLFAASDYAGTDPIGDGYVSLFPDGAGGTTVTYDNDGPASGNPWPITMTTLLNVSPDGLTWAQISGAGAVSPPPAHGGAQLAFSTTSLTLAEGAAGVAEFIYLVARTGDASGSSSANWSVTGSGSNPATGDDFQGGVHPSGTVVFAAGEVSQTITINVAGDTMVEQSEGFTVALSGATGAALGAASAGGTITNDDSEPDMVIHSPGPGSVLVGGSGADTLNASQGGDTLTGGDGADVFAWGMEPWQPAQVTDFVVGTDSLDLSALFATSGYTGADPIADRFVWLLDDGAGGTQVLFDKDGSGAEQQWPNYVVQLDNVVSAGLTWAQLSGAAEPPPPPPPPPTSGSATFVVFAGQSNMGGAYMTEATLNPAWAPDPKVLMWDAQGKAWAQMDPGANTGYGQQPGAWGPEVQFAINFRAQYPDETLMIVKKADGGTGLNMNTGAYVADWSPESSGELFDQAKAMIDEAGVAAGGLRPYAVFFGQGEEDANLQASADAYVANLPAFLTAVREEWMGDSQGKVGIFLIGDTPPYAATVRAAALETDRADPNTTSFDTVDYPLQPDNLHYTAAGYDRAGSGFFDQLMAWNSGVTPPPTPPPPSDGEGSVITSSGYGANLIGGAYNDTLSAGQGPDVVTGGGGADHFVFAAAPWNAGVITDFEPGLDKIDLRGVLNAVGYAGSDALRDQYVILEATAEGAKVIVDLDGPDSSGEWPVTITVLSGVSLAAMTSSDWLLH